MKFAIVYFLAVLILFSTGYALSSHSIKETSLLRLRSDVSIVRNQHELDQELEHIVVFVVKPRKLDVLEKALYEVSYPRHEKYGQNWTRK
jgi:hypothetical protein